MDASLPHVKHRLLRSPGAGFSNLLAGIWSSMINRPAKTVDGTGELENRAEIGCAEIHECVGIGTWDNFVENQA